MDTICPIHIDAGDLYTQMIVMGIARVPSGATTICWQCSQCGARGYGAPPAYHDIPEQKIIVYKEASNE